MRPWMKTYTGLRYVFEAPDVSMVSIEDIAHHLAQIPRFTGAARDPYSVAEHSVHHVYRIREHLGPAADTVGGLMLQREGLMHDATETWLNDLNSPAKSLCADYQRLEAIAWGVVAEKFGLPKKKSPLVKHVDDELVMSEAEALLFGGCEGFNVPARPIPGWRPLCWPFEVAKMRFTHEYFRLFGEVSYAAD